MQRTPKSTLAGIFCLGLSVIMFEIALTRVFAIMMWHHFTYMVISIGLLGFGASGSLMTATRFGENEKQADRALVWVSAAYGFSVVLAFCFATLVRIDSLAIWERPQEALGLALIFLIIFVPFLLGGLGIGLALTRHVKNVNGLYCGDLVGSAIGAALSALLMKSFGSTATVVLAGSFGVLASLFFSFGEGLARWRILSLPAALLAGVLGAGFAGGWLDWRVPYAPGKEANVPEILIQQNPALGKIDKLYSATAEVQVAFSMPTNPMIGGDFGRVDKMAIMGRGVGQDGTAPTMLFEGAADLAKFPFLDDTQAASPYVAHRVAGRKDLNVMVIGVGGGVDVMVALANGAKHVTAVELNSAMIDMVTDRYADYIGRLFDPAGAYKDRVELVNSEGRAWLRSHDTKYDSIQMSGVDSYTALSTGAYTLSESYLYTVQAVKDFYEHLNDGGIATWSRFIEMMPKKPRETLRLANIAVTALRELGVADPAAHVCVFQGGGWASTMFKRGAFTTEEIQALRDFAMREGFAGLVYDPLAPTTQAIEPEPSNFFLIRPQLENDARRLLPTVAADPAKLAEALDGLQVIAAHVGMGEKVFEAMLPEFLRTPELAPSAMQVVEASRTTILELTKYLKETKEKFRTLLRGSEAERAAFVADYEFDVSPSTDDQPFFFNYYRWSALFPRLGGGGDAGSDRLFTYHTEFPVGHAVLFFSMVGILLMAGIMILLPLLKLGIEGERTPGAWRYFFYFAALGLGFMLVEVALMQKLVIFLGHPTYALSVVLTSLLAAAGTGSLLAGRIRVVAQKHILWILLGIVVVIALDVAAVNYLLPTLLGIQLWARMLVVVLLLIPTGLVLGMPFPSGMRIMQEQCPRLVPWGWAINAFFSVFGSLFCIVLSMGIGFSNVFYAAIAVYALGLACMRVRPAASEAVTMVSKGA